MVHGMAVWLSTLMCAWGVYVRGVDWYTSWVPAYMERVHGTSYVHADMHRRQAPTVHAYILGYIHRYIHRVARLTRLDRLERLHRNRQLSEGSEPRDLPLDPPVTVRTYTAQCQ